jgi:hypothetical protein
MEAVVETTVWAGSVQPNHSYLLDGSKIIAYIKQGDTVPFYFKSPITIEKRGRKFAALRINPFKKIKQKDTIIKVAGSKGAIYSIDTEEKTCTCPGYSFRGACKHLTELEKV